tara:strand:- start:6795 stop:7802 length:1008 start_codon:yes stop_codon:yes gene_type:complete
MVLIGPKRRHLQLSKLKKDSSYIVGPPETILFNEEIWHGKPWIVDFLTPTYEENFYRFNNDKNINKSSLLLEKIALLMGSFFIFAHEEQFKSKKDRNKDILKDFLDKDFALIPPSFPSFSFKDESWSYLVWGGGGWDWLDPRTFVEAMNLAKTNYKGVIFSDRYSGSFLRNKKMKGLSSSKVEINSFTNEEAYLNYVNNSLLWICLHPSDTIEANVAYRTRLLDALHVGRPVLVNRGEYLGDFIVKNGGGWFIENENPQALSLFIENLDLEEVKRKGEAARALIKKIHYEKIKKNISLTKPSFEKAKNLFSELKKHRMVMSRFPWRVKTKILGQR